LFGLRVLLIERATVHCPATKVSEVAMTYSDFSVENAVKIVETCLAANKPQMITAALLDRRSPESVEAELAAETARPPERAAPAPAPATSSNGDAFRDVMERRFRSQNGPRTR
jgi:hypothetical protein